jgi:hypothetical protein
LIQRQLGPALGEAQQHSSSFLVGAFGRGQPLDKAARGFFEARFGCNFDHVRVHAHAAAASAARAFGAQAFTFGNDVAFNANRYSPGTPDGRRLLAHELAHVVQQGGAVPVMQYGQPPVSLHTRAYGTPTIQRKPEQSGGTAPILEPQTAEEATRSTPVGSSGSPPITFVRVGNRKSNARVMGIVIATVYYSIKSESHDPAVIFRKVPGAPGKPERVQILFEAQPYVRIRLNRSGIMRLAALHEYGFDVGVRQTGVEIAGTVENGYPILPPQDREIVSADPPVVESPPPLAEVPEPSEAVPPETAPEVSPQHEVEEFPPEKPPPRRLPEPLEVLLTTFERAQIRTLLSQAAKLMYRGDDDASRTLMEKATEIAVGILERKTAALDPETAKEKAVNELLSATADVMFLGGGETETEKALEKVVATVQFKLDRAVERFKAEPTIENARDMANKAAAVMLLGGDDREASELLIEYFPTQNRPEVR